MSPQIVAPGRIVSSGRIVTPIVTLTLIGLLCARATATPAISADEIVQIGASGVGSNYVWGGGCWDPNNRGWKGADCSGFVAKAWQVPDRSPTTSCSHPYTTSVFTAGSSHWSTVDRGSMRKADAYTRNGHIILFAGGDGWGAAEVYEARGTAYGIVHRTATIDSRYKGIRRNDLTASAPPPPTEPPPTEPPPQTLPKLDAQVVRAELAGGIANPDSDVPTAACPGQRFSITIAMRNSGEGTWQDSDQPSAGGAVRLGHAAGEAFGAQPRISLSQQAVAPGQQVSFTFAATAPSAPGRYETEWQLISEMVSWFGPRLLFAVEVSATPPGTGDACDTGQGGDCSSGTLQCTVDGLACVPSGCGDPATPAPPPATTTPDPDSSRPAPTAGAAPDDPARGEMLILSCSLPADAGELPSVPWLTLLLATIALARIRLRRSSRGEQKAHLPQVLDRDRVVGDEGDEEADHRPVAVPQAPEQQHAERDQA